MGKWDFGSRQSPGGDDPRVYRRQSIRCVMWFHVISHGFSWFLMVSHLSSGQRVLASLRLEWAVFSFELRRHDGVSFVGQQ